MPYTFLNPTKYSLIKNQNRPGDMEADFNKINDYLLTFVGDITVVKEKPGQIEISYTEVPFKAILKTNTPQITLTCEEEDNLSVNLIKNVTGNIGYRVFNLQTNAYLVNDPNLLDLTSINIHPKLSMIFENYKLTPLFQYQNSLVFFARDKSGKIHLVNRHLLEYLSQNSFKNPKNAFSVIVAPDITHFIALFDKGLIPISFYESFYNPTKIVNQSGFNPDCFEKEIAIESVFFVLDIPAQSFIQIGANRFDFLKKHGKLVSFIKYALKDSGIKGKLICAKLARDISYVQSKTGEIVPKLVLSVFLEQ